MTVRFMESGGQYHQSNGPGPGIWGTANGTPNNNSTAGSRNGSTWGYGQAAALVTPLLTATGFGAMIAGYAVNIGSTFQPGHGFIQFQDNNSNNQCELRMNASGQLYFTRNGANLGAGNPTLSTATLTVNTYHYLEFKAIFSTTGTGTCEVQLDGVVVLTLTNVTNATTTATAFKVNFNVPNNGFANSMDFYVLDTGTGINTNYLGDVTVAEIYPNAPGVNSAWAVFQPAFTLTSVATSIGGTAVYQGTITNGASPANAWQGFYFTVAGFAGGNNNGTFLCTASNATSITLANGAATAETHAATCSFQNPLQAGIHGGINDGYATINVGTRPPADNQYIVDSTVNDLSDFAHQTLTLVGGLAAVGHTTSARKDDAGTRQIAQICLSAGTQETGATITLGTTYQYSQDILETDPHTSAAWTLAGFNAATFGVKEVA